MATSECNSNIPSEANKNYSLEWRTLEWTQTCQVQLAYFQLFQKVVVEIKAPFPTMMFLGHFRLEASFWIEGRRDPIVITTTLICGSIKLSEDSCKSYEKR